MLQLNQLQLLLLLLRLQLLQLLDLLQLDLDWLLLLLLRGKVQVVGLVWLYGCVRHTSAVGGHTSTAPTLWRGEGRVLETNRALTPVNVTPISLVPKTIQQISCW